MWTISIWTENEFNKIQECDCTVDAEDSSACPRSESRNSVLLRSCEDESRDRFRFSFERFRSRPR